MGRKQTAFSDLTGVEVPEEELGRLVINNHPAFRDTPVYLEALPDELATLEFKNLQVVSVTWQPPHGDPITYILSLKDFDGLTEIGKTSDLMPGAPPFKKKAAGGNGGNKSASNVTAIRRWGRANRFEVQEKGKLSEELKAAYAAAHLEPAPEPTLEG